VADNSIVTSATNHPGHPADHEEFETMVNLFANASMLLGSSSWLDYSVRYHEYEMYPSPSTDDFGAIDGAGNPWAGACSYYGSYYEDCYYNYRSTWDYSDPNNSYLAVFTGHLNVTTGGEYEIAVDGDDAVEVIIDSGTANEQVIGWYGGHGRCRCTNHNATVSLAAGSHTIEFRMEEDRGGDQYYLYWKGPDSDNTWTIIPDASFSDLTLSVYNLRSTASSIVDYSVRVRVCDSTVGLESNCQQYPDGNYKPVGLLQRNGETRRMYFGLMTGSYAKNTSGGVLRKPIGDISNEIVSSTGQFDTSVNGIIQTLSRLRIYGFDYTRYIIAMIAAGLPAVPCQGGNVGTGVILLRK
jgi:type IV pilus assembly protein PilY1